MTGQRPISFFLPTLDPGGAERKTVILANGFAARGRSVEICTAMDAGGILRLDVHPSVRIVPLGIRRVRYSLGPIRRYLRRARPRVFVCIMHHAAVFGVLANAVSGTSTPIVVIEGGINLSRLQGESAIGYAIHRAQVYLLYRRAARVIVNSAPIATEFAAHAHMPQERMDVIPNPSAVAVFDDDGDAARDLPADWPPGDAPALIAVSRLDKNKDVATLLRAFAVLRARRPLSLVIVGDGPERVALQTLADSLGVARDVYFLGERPKPWRYVRWASVFVNASRTEGFSNALIEAMAVGCPIVATAAVGGTAFILEDGRHGRLVPVGDHGRMADAIAQMLAAPTPSEQLIERARAFADGQIDAYLQAIERCAN